MRPTDFCHHYDLRAPVPRAFPARSATFIAWIPHGVLGSARCDWGTECFTALENASADHNETRAACFAPRREHRCRWFMTRAWAFLPTAPLAIEPLTPLSLSRFLPRDSGAPSRCLRQLWPFRALSLLPRGGLAEAAVTTSREREWLVTTRGAFHRPVPFVGFGGLYSPGPVTASTPLREEKQPLNDVLTSSWVWTRSRTVHSGALRILSHRFERLHPRHFRAERSAV
jgi:hypothetical protein